MYVVCMYSSNISEYGCGVVDQLTNCKIQDMAGTEQCGDSFRSRRSI